MAVLGVSAVKGRLVAEGGGPPGEALDRALAATDPGYPLVVMIHGFRYRPGLPGRDPHRHILSLEPDRDRPRAVSWPRRLGLAAPGRAGLGFGWDAKGTIWGAAQRADRAAEALAGLISRAWSGHGRQVAIVAHSLGARVALGAVAEAPRGAVAATILMAAAAFRDEADRALAQAGDGVRFVNVTSGENRAFAALTRAALAPGRATLNAGLGRADPCWIDLAIDDDATRAGLARLGYRVPPPVRRVCHWSAYLRPGLFPLYRGLLGPGGPAAFTRLRDAQPSLTGAVYPAPPWTPQACPSSPAPAASSATSRRGC